LNNNGFSFFVARRYLSAKRKQAMISVITVISIVGVAAGVMALVIALAINNGFRSTLQRSLLGARGHVMLLAKEPSAGIQNWELLAPKMLRIPHVTAAAPGLYSKVLLTGVSQSEGAELKGISIDQPPDMLRHLKQGSFDALHKSAGLPGIILGARLAQNTGMLLDSVVNVMSPQGEMTPFGPHFTRYQFRVVGIFESGFYDIDAFGAFTSLQSAQRVLSLGDVVNTIELRLDDIYQAPEVARIAEQIAGPAIVATTWMEQYRQILNALNTEKVVTAVTIGLIQLVAGLNILIALIMMVMEKNRDIAILMAMGAKQQQIRAIFLTQGVIIGIVGTAIGLALGYSLSFLADHYRWLRLDQEVYAVAYVPFAARWVDGLWIAGTAIFVSFIATIYPARSASRIAPAEALRYE
jgi:lipoprotein-releasing system permease protein